MRKLVVTLVTVLALFTSGTMLIAADSRGLPFRYAPRSMDGEIRLLELPDSQSTVAVWAYRSGAQYDIAISTTDANGDWSDPVFIGRDDGRNQIDPVIAADASGNVYLAYTDVAEGSVKLSTRPAGRTDWTPPVGVTPQAAQADRAGVMVVGQRLVVAYNVGRQIQMIDLPLLNGAVTVRTINDSPDPIGREDDTPPDDDDPPSGHYSPKKGRSQPPGE